MGDLLTRRRELILASGGEPAPLYPITARTSGAFAGTGGQIAKFDYQSGNQRYCGILEARSATSSGSASGNRSKKFTIPANSVCVLSVRIISKRGNLNYIGFTKANATSRFLEVRSSSQNATVGSTYTATATPDTDVDIGELSAHITYSSGSTCAFEFEVTLTVDGVRYI